MRNKNGPHLLQHSKKAIQNIGMLSILLGLIKIILTIDKDGIVKTIDWYLAHPEYLMK